jgi:hypothetical protein
LADDAIKFDRKPYTVTYREDATGQMKTIRRTPPPKLHEALPTDIVELNHKKSDDFRKGDEVEVVYINPRHPNTLKIRNGDGVTTFVEYYDANLKEEVAPRPDVDPRDRPVNNRYLLWP